jgi:hypothetical protein
MDRLIRRLLLAALAAMLAAPAATADSTTVEGVTVKGRHAAPPKCAANDKDCILIVAKALWDQYPEQTQRYCLQEENRAWTTRFNLQAMPTNDPAGNDNGRSSQVAPALKAVCDYVTEQAKAKKAAAEAGQH